uniref:Peptidase S1 domain-containing protein n=1 Tax=Sus scrofa TaxID=9823 RepID=A0A8D1AK66_PIG
MCRLPLPLLLFLLCSRAKAGEGIIGGTESKPHSRPCMAHLETVTPQDKLPARGGFLIRRGFVRTAAHCAGRDTPAGPEGGSWAWVSLRRGKPQGKRTQLNTA